MSETRPHDLHQSNLDQNVSSVTQPTHAVVSDSLKRVLVVGLVILVLGAVVAVISYLKNSTSHSRGIDSIAVLPFANANGDQSLEYLSDGLTETLIDRLSQLPGVKVIARTSAFKYKGTDVDPREIGAALGVQTLVMGRVLEQGDDLRVRVELVDAQDGTQLWGEQYARKSTDIQWIQEEIARTISENLRLHLSGAQEKQLTKHATQNSQAYQSYLNGIFYMRQGGFENVRKALNFYNQAVMLDPNFALAWVEVANVYRYLEAKSLLEPQEALAKAKAAAQKALEADEMLSEAHGVLARIKQDEWDWVGAQREYKRALELNPNMSDAHSRYSQYLSATGQHVEALAESKRAQELDPLRQSLRNAGALYAARRYDEALENVQRMVRLQPDFGEAHGVLGVIYDAKGMHEQAINEFQKWMSIDGETTSILCYLGYAFARSGKRNEAQAILDKLKTTKEYVSPGELAILYIGLGDKETALSMLERAWEVRDPQMGNLKVDQYYDALRTDSRFQGLMRRVGFPS